MKEKIRKKTKRPQTEDMIFTEEDFEDVSEAVSYTHLTLPTIA